MINIFFLIKHIIYSFIFKLQFFILNVNVLLLMDIIVFY